MMDPAPRRGATGNPVTGSSVTARAMAFVADRRAASAALGHALAELAGDPDAFARALTAGLAELADPEYRAGQRFIAPGIGETHGVRNPLLTEIGRAFRAGTRQDPAAPLLFVADRLFRERELEARWFAFGILSRTVTADPERTWQLIRRAGREAADWITVDTLAHCLARGIVAESYRWAELEGLTLSPNHWERRLVGSTIATLPFTDRAAGRRPEVAERGLALLCELIGDAEPDVQKALAWAYRSLAIVDRPATAASLAAEADTAARTSDGHRAWVIRDALAKIDEAAAASIRQKLEGIRRRPGAPSTSRAAETAARFGAMGLGLPGPEPPLI